MLTPASSATSSRRNPGVRRACRRDGRAKSSGSKRSRRLRRNAASSCVVSTARVVMVGATTRVGLLFPGISVPYPGPAAVPGLLFGNGPQAQEDTMPLTLDTYRLLGRSGLRVSPLALGAATFGTEWGWGAEQDEARKLFDRYVERGGNVIDTASTYTEGSSERLLGEFARDNRDSLVLATKYTTLRRPGDPNSGGSHRKSLFASVEASLRRLGTDYIDLLYLHVWDFMTPVEEILRGMDDLVRQGKVRYVAVSNVPAWQVARMQAIADLRGWSPLVALQIEYSLVERTGERDLIPMAREMGLGVLPYSPLAGGVVTGKYSRDDLAEANAAAGDGTRKSLTIANGM